MSTTHVLIWERRNRIAGDAHAALFGLAVKIVSVDDETELRETLAKCESAVVILERSAVGERLPDVIAAADLSLFRVIVVGMASADEARRDRDLGAHLLIGEANPGVRWTATLRRLATAASRDLEWAKAIGPLRR
jgi:hypothetical protein